MTEKQYQSKTGYQWERQVLKSNRELRNAWCALPAGTLFTVRRKHKGFHLQSEPCKCCGIKVYIANVEPEAVDHVLPPSTQTSIT